MRWHIPLFGFQDLEKQFKWSLILHILFIIASMIGLPNLAKKPLIMPPNVVVDLVAPSELTAAPNTTKEKPAPQKPVTEPEKPKPAPKSAPPKTVDQPKIDKPKPVEKTESKPEPIPTKKADKKVNKKIEKKEPPKETAPAQKEEFSSLLKNLVGDEPSASAPPTVDAPVDNTKETGKASVISDNLTLSQADALRHQLASCWNIPIGARDAENLVVEILATVGPDRVVKTTEIVDKGRYKKDPFYRSAADSARRALLNPLCSPLSLPEDKYELWKTMRIRFNPKEMFGG